MKKLLVALCVTALVLGAELAGAGAAAAASWSSGSASPRAASSWTAGTVRAEGTEAEETVLDGGKSVPSETEPTESTAAGLNVTQADESAVPSEDSAPIAPESMVTTEPLAGDVTAGAVTASAPSVSATRAEIVRLTNALRAQKGIAALKTDPRLDSVAQSWSVEQVKDYELRDKSKKYELKHNPSVGGQVPQNWNLIGENVAYGQETAAEVVNAWRHSAGHYKNIMTAGFTHIGVGIAFDSGGSAFYTQVFVGYSKGLAKPGVFTDVSPGAPFYKEIAWMLSSGLSKGVATPAGRAYQPKASVSREAMAAFLYRLKTPNGAAKPAGYTIPSTSPFNDVPRNHKFFKEIAWMASSGISTGITNPGGKPSYAPKAAVSREAMAAFIFRLQGESGYETPKQSKFADVKLSHKFFKQISWMYTSGLSTGVKQRTGKPQYQPDANVSREAMAAFIYRLEH